MKLVFAIKSLADIAGGAERVFCTVCSELIALGHEVVAVTFDAPGGQPFYPLDARVRRIDLGIGRSGERTTATEFVRRILGLRRTLWIERPDAAVGFMNSMYVPLSLAAVGTGTVAIGSEHSAPDRYFDRRLEYATTLAAALLLTRITVVNDAFIRRFPRLVRGRVVAITNPVKPATEFSGSDRAATRRTILTVGRLVPEKDHATLLLAFAQLAESFPDWDLRIVGEGRLRPDLERLSAALGLVDRVTMPGVITTISREYASADLFAIASRHEAFGLVTAEAMSHGLSAVGFADCPGTNELIIMNKTGLLVEPGKDRAAALSQGLRLLMSDAELRRRLGAAGRDAIANRFSPAEVCRSWERLLAEVAVRVPARETARVKR